MMSAAGVSDERPTDEARATHDRERIALAIQQPWAELILRGIKTLEIRSQPTRQRGTILLYASKRVSALPAVARRHAVSIWMSSRYRVGKSWGRSI